MCFCSVIYAENIEYTEVIGISQQRQSINDIDLKQYNGFENIVTRVEFEDRFIELNDIVNKLPSVQTRNAGGIGGFSSTSIRGSSSKQVNIFVDGILLSSPESGFSNLSIIPTSIIEAVEVFPDFTPVQLSDGNLAGAINIRTRKVADGNNGGRISTTYGSFNTKRLELSSWFNYGKTDYLIAASTINADNDFPVHVKSFAGVSAGKSKKRENAAFEQNDIFFKLRSHLNDTLTLQTVLNHSESDNELPTRQNKKLDSAILEKEMTRADITLESTKDNYLWGIRIFGFDNDDIFSDQFKTLALNPQIIEQNLQGMGSAIHYEITLNNHQLSTSMDISESDIDTINQLETSEKVISDRKKLTAAVADTWHIKSDTSLHTTIRFYNVADKATIYTKRPSNSCTNGTTNCGDSKHRKTSWQTGLSHQINQQWLFKINTGEFIRIPTLSEKFGNFGNYIAKPELKPEESTNTDMGFIFDNQQLRLQATGFYKKISDGIFIEYDTNGTGHPDNIGKAWITGFEGALSWKVNNNWTADISGHAMDSENQSDIKAHNGQKIFGIYHTGFLSAITWHNQLHSVSLSYQINDELSYIESGKDKADKKEITNLSYTLFQNKWTINFSINNLLDEIYSDYTRMPASGRSYFATINYEFN